MRKYEKIVNLVLQKPKQCKSEEDYFKVIGPQLILLLQSRSRRIDHIHRATTLCAGKFIELFPVMANKYFLQDIVKPLRQCLEIQQRKRNAMEKLREKLSINMEQQSNEEDQKPEVVLVDESNLVQCVEDLHTLLVGYPPSQPFLNSIGELMPALFQLYCFISRTKLNVKSACEEVITTYFKLSDDALAIVKKLLVFKRPSSVHEWFVKFAPGESGGVCIRIEPER